MRNSVRFLCSRLLLVVIGLAGELIYLLYFVRSFPLLHFYTSLVDLGNLTGHTSAACLTFSLVLIVLFGLFAVAWRQAHRYEDRATLWLVLFIGAILSGTAIFVYPLTAIDIYTYITTSLVGVYYHANPTLVPPSAYASFDPVMGMTSGWGWMTAPYGPLGTTLDSIPTFIAQRNLLLNLLLLKGMFSSCILMSAFLAYTILRHLAPHLAISGALFLAWNPFMLMEYSVNGHNDIMMMFVSLLAMLALVRKHYVVAMALITASALIKYATGALWPIFLIYGMMQQAENRQRWLFLVNAVAVSLLIAALCYLPFWHGWSTISSALVQDDRYAASFPILLNFLFPDSISWQQGKMPGRIIYALFYIIYIVFLLKRPHRSTLLAGSFLALFLLQAFAMSNFDIWYGVWSFALMAIIPDKDVRIAGLLFAFGISFSAIFYEYLWSWLALAGQNVAIIHSAAYLLSFGPALCWMVYGLRKFSWARVIAKVLSATPTTLDQTRPPFVQKN